MHIIHGLVTPRVGVDDVRSRPFLIDDVERVVSPDDACRAVCRADIEEGGDILRRGGRRDGDYRVRALVAPGERHFLSGEDEALVVRTHTAEAGGLVRLALGEPREHDEVVVGIWLEVLLPILLREGRDAGDTVEVTLLEHGRLEVLLVSIGGRGGV